MELSPYNDKILSVSEVNAIARAMLETRLGAVRIEGEIANLSRPASGHMYFSLKDSKAQVSCAMFRNRSIGMRFKPAVGDLVIASGKVSLYEARGNYQLIVDTLEPAGAGALQQAFDALKEKLWKEGLFEEAVKKPIPTMPSTIGIITSPSGAAVRDALHVLQRRNPMAQVIIYPCAVQGDDAARQIRQQVELADARQECDVLLLCRGGGSMEDLWSFNDEALARAIHACSIPIVNGVGHEIDFTIADFVADMRAPTPSAAAEMVSPNRSELIQRVRGATSQLRRIQQRMLDNQGQRLDWLDKQLQLNHPLSRIQRYSQRTAQLTLRLRSAIQSRMQRAERRHLSATQRLSREHPGQRLMTAREKVLRLRHRLEDSNRKNLTALATRINRAADKLNVLDPSHTLQRGYAIVFDAESGQLLKSVDAVKNGQSIKTQLSDGNVSSTIDSIIPAEPPKQ